MRRNQLREFPEPGIVVGAGLKGEEDFLEADERGVLAVPPSVNPIGFHLVVATKEDDRTFVVQKNVGRESGGYHRHALSELKGFAKGFRAIVMRDPIEVVRAGSSVWTSWHQDKPNRVDIWSVGKDGTVMLFQVGVITHDNGATWKLHGEYRWKGQLFRDGDKIVGKPEHPRWGAFDVRRTILEQAGFMELVKSARLEEWSGSDEQLNPPLPEVPGPGHAVVQWYITFAGQTGQGPANLYPSDGTNAWIHGTDILGLAPDPDREIRLWQGDIVSFTGTAKFGKKPNGPPKLLGVRLVERSW